MGDADTTRRSYDRVAGRYADRFTAELEAKPFDRDFLDELAGALASGGWVVDLGSGPGQIGAQLAAGGAPILSVDLSHEMLRAAARLVPKGARVQADMRALPLAGGAVQCLVAFYALVHIPPEDLAGTLAEVGRALMPGGHVAVAVHVAPMGGAPTEDGRLHVEEMLDEPVDLDFWFYRADELVPALRSAGFDVVRAAEREPYGPEVESQTRRLYVLARKR